MTELYFTHEGKQHYIRVLSVDRKDTGALVYEGLIDGREYVYWESDPDSATPVTAWTLFRDALNAYIEHKEDDTITKTRWRD